MREKIFLIPLIGVLLCVATERCCANASGQLEQARTLLKNGQYDQAEGIYMQILSDHPPAEVAFEAQKQLVLLHIAADNQPKADEALDQLIARHWQSKDIAEAIWHIAVKFGKAKKKARALEIHRYNAQTFADDMYAMKSQTEIIFSHIRDDEVAAAGAAVNDLLSTFSQQPTLPKEIYQVAREYEKYEKYDEACDLYRYDFENFPDDVHAMMSQAGIVKFYIRRGNDGAADAAFDDLLTIFADEPTLQEEIHHVAKKYEELEKYDKALALYQYNVESFPNDARTMWSQVMIVRSHIRAGNAEAADEALDKLLTLFSEQPTLPEEVYKIANKFNEAGNGQKARQVYQCVIASWADSRFAILSRAGIASVDVSAGNDDAAKAVIDKLIAEFNDHADSPTAVFLVGETYWNLGQFEPRRAGVARELNDKAVDYFTKALGVWERIITELPRCDATPRAYYFSANCCEKIGNPEKAIELREALVREWPDYKYAWNAQVTIGFCYERLAWSKQIPVADAAKEICLAAEKVLTNYPGCMATGAARNLLRRWERVSSE